MTAVIIIGLCILGFGAGLFIIQALIDERDRQRRHLQEIKRLLDAYSEEWTK